MSPSKLRKNYFKTKEDTVMETVIDYSPQSPDPNPIEQL